MQGSRCAHSNRLAGSPNCRCCLQREGSLLDIQIERRTRQQLVMDTRETWLVPTLVML